MKEIWSAIFTWKCKVNNYIWIEVDNGPWTKVRRMEVEIINNTVLGPRRDINDSINTSHFLQNHGK